MKKKEKEYEIVIETIAKKDIKKGEKIRIKIASASKVETQTNRGEHFLKK